MLDPATNPRPQSSRTRWLVYTVVLVAGLVLLAALSLTLALRSPSIRTLFLERAASSIETATGVYATARDFTIDWRHATIEFSAIELRARSRHTSPFLTVDRLRGELVLRSLRTSRWQVRYLELDSPILDLGAPLPAKPDSAEDAESEFEWVVDRLKIHTGRVEAPEGVFAEDSWLEHLSIQGLDAEGAIRSEELTLEVPLAAVKLDRRGAEPVFLALTARLGGQPAGPFELESLSLSGPGLKLGATGYGGFEPEQPLELAFDLAAEIGLLIPGLAAGGSVHSEGSIDWRLKSGQAQVRAHDVPAAVVAPWLGQRTMERLAAAATHLDVEADLGLAAGTITGQGSLDWRRGEDRLLTATADVARLRLAEGGDGTLGGAISELAGELRVEASDLPAELLIEPWLGQQAAARMQAAGTRFDLDATYALAATAPGGARGKARLAWQRGKKTLLTANLTTSGGALGNDGKPDFDTLAGTLRLSGRDLPPALARPWIDRATLERFGTADTALDLEADLVMAVHPPSVTGRADVTWRDPAGRLLAATMRAAKAPGRGLPIEIEAELLPDSPGRRRGTGTLRAPSWSTMSSVRVENGRVDLELPDLGLARTELHDQWPKLVPETAYDQLVEGSLEATVNLTGRPAKPDIEATITWRRPDGAVLTLDATGEPATPRGEARLHFEALELASLQPAFELRDAEMSGRLAGSLELAGSATAWTAVLRLDGEQLRRGTELPGVDRLELEAIGDASMLQISRLEARAGDRHLIASGHGELEPVAGRRSPWPRLGPVELRLELTQPIAGIDRMLANSILQDGIATIDATEIDLPGGRGELHATIPLATLKDLPEVGDKLAGWVGHEGPFAATAEGPMKLRFSLPGVDSAELLHHLGMTSVETAAVAASGELTLDPTDLTATSGALVLPTLTLAWDGHRLETVEPIRLRLANRRLALERSRFRIDGRDIELAGGADLTQDWRPRQPLGSLATRVEARGEGTIEAELLNPYLGGAAASGPLQMTLELDGPPNRLNGRLTATGPQARLVALAPYFTRIDNPQIELEIEAGRVVLSRGRARFNQGAIELTGNREPGGELELIAHVEGVRYHLDYGLSTVLSGDLSLALPAEGRGRLGGRLIVERGLLRRNLNLEREILGKLMAPSAPAVPDPEDPLTRIDLDLDLATADGVRIKNNLANLRATWSPLTVRGTLAEPRVDGRLDVEGGGFVYLYGQTARVDQATVTLAGFPELPPELDLELTTSLEDPEVARQGAGSQQLVAAPRGSDQIEADRQALLAAGVASHYADQLAGRVGQALGGTRISVAPLLVFGETDPGARLTVSRDLSTQIAVAVSVDLRTEGRQTYLLDLHDFRSLPRMSAQLFTNDERNPGVTVQQSIELGGLADEAGPRLRRILAEVPTGFDAKGIRSATGLRRGDRLPESAEFDVEVDLAEHLRQKGYPGAEVTAKLEPAPAGARDLVIAVKPGPRVAFEFRGTQVPRPARRSIRGLYRTDYFEPAAIEEMRRDTIRTLHSLGHPRPEVTIEVITGNTDPGAAGGLPDRTVVVEAHGGERRPVTAVELRGVPNDVGGRLASIFAAQADRIELAIGLAEADRRLLGLLRGAGYPDPQIESRRLEDGERLVIEIQPGRRQRLAEVVIEGVSPAEAERLRDLLGLAPGAPPRSDQIARGAVAIERDLRQQGHVEARARALTAVPEPKVGGTDDALILTYQVEPGPRYQVAEVRFDGATATGPRWAGRVAQINEGTPVDPEALAEARRRLFGTGLFRSVVPDVELGDNGQAAVVFDLRERPRYQLSYGLRWESSIGGGAVVDVFDRNAFGRGVTLGVRSLWSADDESARFYSIFPKVFGTRSTVELYVEGRRLREGIETGTLVTSRSEGTFQVSYPLGRHTTTRGYYRYRDSHLFEEDPDPVNAFDQRIRSPILGWQLVHDTRDDKIDATRGLLSSLDLTGAGDTLGSDSRFLRFFAKTSLFRRAWRVAGRPLTWAQSWRVGLAETFGGQELNREDRFFAGGELSVRGYREQSLGSRQQLGTTIIANGGEALLVVNQELRLPLRWGLQGLIFFDAGNVWDLPSDFGSDFFTAAGVGLRATTPVGLVRLDVALPLDQRPEDDDYKVYLGLGNVF